MAEQAQTYEKLFAEFSPSSREDWIEATVKSLKGKAFDKLIKTTYEGIDLQPMYRAEDIENIAHKDALPGQYPYVRGTQAEGHQSGAWYIAQDINISDPKAFNDALKHDLERGQTAIYVGDHLQINSVENLEILFADIDLTRYFLIIHADVNAGVIFNLLKSYLKDDFTKLEGCIGSDPLRRLAKIGIVSQSWFGGMSNIIEQSANFNTIAIRTDVYHDAGANAVQELAIAMATGVTYINEMLERRCDINSVARQIQFFLSIGENFFMEIAKLRAIKMMWAQIVREFGGDSESQKIKIHASTGTRNKTRLDAHVNMLRVTTEAMAGAIGGVESMSVAPFDAPFGESDDFSRRIARNVHLILQEEVKLAEVIDPAGGSWYVEHLTDQLAQSAWEFFQQIEAQGGMISALQNNFIQNQIQALVDTRHKNISSRKDILVGTNMYSDLNEILPTDKPLKLDDTAPFDDLTIEAKPLKPVRLSEPFEILRSNAEKYRQAKGTHPQIFLANFGELSDYKARMDFTQGFYEVGGFELINQGGYDSIESAINASLASDAKAIVICSTDGKYAEIVPDFAQAIKAQKPAMIVILAGYPQDKIDEYKQAGVDDFIHIRANCYEMNKQLQDQLGVGK